MLELYLSRLIIPESSRLSNRLLDEYDIHRLVYRMFHDSKDRCFLYYLDYGGMGNLSILIQSTIPPEDIGVGRLEIKHVPEEFLKCRRYYFHLRFSPVVKKDGHVVSIRNRHDDAVQWLTSRESGYGIALIRSSLDKESGGVINMRKGNQRITITYVDMTGELEVVDNDQFIRTVLSGIGPNKGFGLGMLQLVPLKEDNK